MASILPALLLVLFLQCAPTYSQPWHFHFPDSHQPCVIANATIGGEFHFNISTMYYMANTNYTVMVSGFGENATIALSSYFNGSAVGKWINNAVPCDGVKGVRNMIATEQWTSPATIGASDTVEIRTFVDTMNGTYVKNITLTQININTTGPMSTTVYMSTTTGTTRTTTVTTPNSAPGLSSNSLQAFVCFLLLLVTVPGL